MLRRRSIPRPAAVRFLGGLLLCVTPVLGSWADPATEAAETCAREFLQSWVYRDFERLWDLLDDSSRAGFSQEALAASLEAIPIFIERAEVVAAQAGTGGVDVRYRLHGVHATSGAAATLPGTLRVLSADGGCAVLFRPPSLAARVPSPSGSSELGSVSQASRAALPGLPPSQVIDGLTAQDVLDRAATAHGQLQSLRMGVSIQSNVLGEANQMRGEFLYRAPSQLRLDLGNVLFVCDGISATMFLPPANAYVRLPSTFSGDLLGIAPGLGGAGSSMQASLIARETVGGRPAYHLALAPSPGGGGGDLLAMLGSMGPTHIWLDAETLMPLRTRTGVMGMMMDLTFTSVEINPEDLSPEAFEFHPPPGAMEIPMMLPILGGG